MSPIASLSLDLDNAWSYLKTRGDPRWQEFPSYLDLVVPRVLAELRGRSLTITFFVVGQDAAIASNRGVLGSIATSGHEIGNHSFRHEPWLHRYSEDELDDELARAEEAIGDATGCRPRGFRGPGYSLSAATLRVLVRRGYEYDASTLPTYLGPLARAYYFRRAALDEAQRRDRAMLFGTFRDGLRPVRPYSWRIDGRDLLEVPVTTLPAVKVPMHFSYLLSLASISPTLGRAYFRAALTSCRLAGVGPSLLLHPLDFLGPEDAPDLAFFPAMGLSAATKIAELHRYLDLFERQFEVVPVGQHARDLRSRPDLLRVEPDFRCDVPFHAETVAR
jgi:peptidoglycan-N-acetylglucosamine deacetylase